MNRGRNVVTCGAVLLDINRGVVEGSRMGEMTITLIEQRHNFHNTRPNLLGKFNEHLNKSVTSNRTKNCLIIHNI